MCRKILLFALLFFSSNVNAQGKEVKISLTKSCPWDGRPVTGTIHEYQSDNDALEVINRIVTAVGLQPNFSIRGSDVPNALATNDNGERIIFYNLSFLKKIDRECKTNWASVSVLAHEVGHHYNNDPLDGGSGRAYFELAADEFSGFVLHKIGATLEEAQMAADKFLPTEGSSTYPPKSSRLKAIEKGWGKDEPEFPMSDDFKSFIASLPVTIYAKPKNEISDRFKFSGTGKINLSVKGNKYLATGSIDFTITSDDYFKSIKGDFEGELTWNPPYTTLSNYPIKESINLNGQIHVITKNGRSIDYPFTYLDIYTEGPNYITCLFGADDIHLGFVLAAMNFRK